MEKINLGIERCDETYRAFHLELVELDLHLLLSLFILDQLTQVSEEIMVEHWKTNPREWYLIKLSSFSSLMLL